MKKTAQKAIKLKNEYFVILSHPAGNPALFKQPKVQ